MDSISLYSISFVVANPPRKTILSFVKAYAPLVCEIKSPKKPL